MSDNEAKADVMKPVITNVQNNVLKFPRQKMTRVQKKEARRFALSLSILSVAVVALTLSENLSSKNRPTYISAGSSDRLSQINRAIASAQPYDLVEDVQWENELATKISSLSRRPSAIGQTPSALDQLRFGPLAGKYRIAESSARVREIEYVDSDDVSDKPVYVRDRQAFLQQNKSVLAVAFSSVKVEEKEGLKETYSLLDPSGRKVGQAGFVLDENGRMISMKVQTDSM